MCEKMIMSSTSQAHHTIKDTSDIILPQEAKPYCRLHNSVNTVIFFFRCDVT